MNNIPTSLAEFTAPKEPPQNDASALPEGIVGVFDIVENAAATILQDQCSGADIGDHI